MNINLHHICLNRNKKVPAYKRDYNMVLVSVLLLSSIKDVFQPIPKSHFAVSAATSESTAFISIVLSLMGQKGLLKLIGVMEL